MASLKDYADKYETVKLMRRNGILQMTLHTNGGPVQWGPTSQSELVDAFTQIGADRENRIVILTGAGNQFSGPKAEPGKSFYREISTNITADLLDRTHWNAKRLMTRMLDIEVPMIGVVNGPAMRHSELPLMCDIVIAADDATFEDTAHFDLASQVPGDGINIVYTLLMGLNRARYFMLTGQVLSAREAKDMGLVSEVLPRDQLLAARVGAGGTTGGEERSPAALYPRRADGAAAQMDGAVRDVPPRARGAGQARQRGGAFR